jgi:ribosomal peptide maturation radical SAM protein 1
MSGPELLLVSMPWASARRPNLGLSTLSATLQAHGVACTVYYPCISFATDLGLEAYETLADTPGLFGACEHCFALSIFDSAALDSPQFLARYTLANGSNPFVDIRQRFVDRFLERTVAYILGTGAPVVGFGCTFNQTLPALAVAFRLRQLRPDLTIIFGGSSLHGPMGEALAAAFAHAIDHVFLGEADTNLVDFVKARRSGADLGQIPGITVHGQPTCPALPTEDLDAVPIPRYADYLAQIHAHGLTADFVEAYPFESSRGCWWGQKNHCTFCGLNSEGMAYRRKSDERILRELVTLSGSYQTSRLMGADNILSHDAWKRLLPGLADLGLDLRLFFEIKANLGRDRVAELRRAGVHSVQPGIESFSTAVLQLMRKGLTGLQNVRFIRLCKEFGVHPSYNLLVGFPGETEADYRAMADLIGQIRHLPPPSGAASLVQIHRFSPFHERAADFGFADAPAAAHYRHLIPPAVLAPQRYAYFFERPVTPEAELHLSITNAAVSAWLASQRQIEARLCPGFIEISDDQAGRIALDEASSAVLLAADDVHTRSQLLAGLVQHMGLTEPAGNTVLDRLLAQQWLAAQGPYLVSTVPFAEPHSTQQLAAWSVRWLPQAAYFLHQRDEAPAPDRKVLRLVPV